MHTPEAVILKQKRKNSDHRNYEDWIAFIVIGMGVMVAIPIPEVYLCGLFGSFMLIIGVVIANG